MDFATIAARYLARYKTAHGRSADADQWSALNAILGCRTEQYGQMQLSCDACSWQGVVICLAAIAVAINAKTTAPRSGLNDSQ
jgi:hypothetical protein